MVVAARKHASAVRRERGNGTEDRRRKRNTDEHNGEGGNLGSGVGGRASPSSLKKVSA